MHKRSKISNAVRLALSVTTGAALLAPVGAMAQSDDADIMEVEETLVTGSRIKRRTANQSQEVVMITAEDMEITGDVSVADALRYSNLNSIGSFRESSGNSAQSNATINLRGAGAGRTLVLINGRRVAGSPSLGGGGTVNLNLIPFSAVDRIEVVADGASAVYGSDAVAGVVNIILKRDYEGFKFTTRNGERDEDGAWENSISFLAGASSDRGSVTFGLEWDRREPIFDADRDYTKARWNDDDGDGHILGYGESAGVSFYGYSLINPTYDSSKPFSNTDQSTWYVSPGANCVDNTGSGGGFVGPLKADLVFGPDAGFYCGYAYALVSANRAGLERMNSWVAADYQLNDNIEAYIDVIWSENESFGRYAPPAAPGPTIPGDARNDVGATFGYFRWTDIGTRDNEVSDTFMDINVGFRGDINDSLSWDVNYTNSDYESSSVGMYYLSYAGLEYNISYNITDFDTFVNNMKATTHNDDRTNLEKYFAGLQWDMFEMEGGTASAYFAAEYYEIDYQALVDAQSEAGLIGGSAGNSARGDRSVTAFSVEAMFPVLEWLEVDVAVRHDDYSDFGTATSPRVGMVMTLPDYEQVRFKISWGEGFRAPDLSDLYGATSFSAEGAIDYYGCSLAGQDPCPTKQFDTYIGSNPNLDAETSETFSIGAEWNFTGDWVASVNWFNLELEDSIEYTSAQDQLNVDNQTGGNNPAVIRNALGGVVEISAGFQNAVTKFKREAVDFQLYGSWETRIGTINFNGAATHYTKYDSELTYGTGDKVNAAGDLGFPKWRGNMYFNWVRDNWTANLSYDYIGDSKDKRGDSGTKWDSWDMWNASVGYSTDSFGTFTIGANNLTNEDPLLDDYGSPRDEYQYPFTGRVWYARYSIEF